MSWYLGVNSMDTSYDQVDEAQQHKFLRDCAYLIFVGNAKTINCVFHTYVIVLWALNGYKNQDHHNPNHGCMFRWVDWTNRGGISLQHARRLHNVSSSYNSTPLYIINITTIMDTCIMDTWIMDKWIMDISIVDTSIMDSCIIDSCIG